MTRFLRNLFRKYKHQNTIARIMWTSAMRPLHSILRADRLAASATHSCAQTKILC